MEESNYKIAYDNEWKFLKKKNPLEVSRLRGAKWNADKETFSLMFLNEEYLISWKEEKILKKENSHCPSVDAGIMILNYLRHSDINVANGYCFESLKEMPNGGALFYPAFYKNSILPLCQKFGKDLDAFMLRGKILGGVPIKSGDVGLLFKVFPLIDLKVVIWAGDDELSPSANILFDTAASELMHIESVIGLGMYLSKELRKDITEEERR